MEWCGSTFPGGEEIFCDDRCSDYSSDETTEMRFRGDAGGETNDNVDQQNTTHRHQVTAEHLRDMGIADALGSEIITRHKVKGSTEQTKYSSRCTNNVHILTQKIGNQNNRETTSNTRYEVNE